MLAGYLLFGFVPILVRYAHLASFNAPSVVFIRFIIACFCILIISVFTGQKLHTSRPTLLVLRGVFGGLAVLCFFFAVQETGAGVGALLNYTHSIWANVLSVMVMKQKPPKRFWGLLILASIGLFLVIDPRFSTFQWGEILGLISGVLGGAAILCIKELRRTDSALTVLTSFSLAGLLLALPFIGVGLDENQRSGWQHLYLGLVSLIDSSRLVEQPILISGWLAVLAVGLFAFFGQFLFTQAYKNTSVQLGTIMSLIVPVIATLSGWLFLHEVITVRFGVGATMILIACAVTGTMEKG